MLLVSDPDHCISSGRSLDACDYLPYAPFFVRRFFAKFRKTLLASSCLSVCPRGTFRLPQDGFSWNLIFEYFSEKTFEKIQLPLKSDKNIGYFTMKTDIHFWSYLANFFLEWEMFQTKVVEKIKTHILFSVTFFRKSCRLWDNVEKYGITRQCKAAQKRCAVRTGWLRQQTHTQCM